MNNLDAARREAGLSYEQLWTRYFSLGGLADATELEALLAGLLKADRAERALIASAINEAIAETQGTRAPLVEPPAVDDRGRVLVGAARLVHALTVQRSRAVRKETVEMRLRAREIARQTAEQRRRTAELWSAILEQQDRTRRR